MSALQLGIFSKHFARQTSAQAFDAVRSHGLSCVQFNFETCGLPAMADEIDDALCERVRSELAERRVAMTAVSGTFNIIHPDVEERQRGLRQLAELARVCPLLGTTAISLCTGTRNPNYMWSHHPDNNEPEAWRDLVSSLETALEAAEERGVTLAFEPEVANVVDSARKARRLLDEMRSPHLKVIIDGANIYHAGELSHMGEMLAEAFELLGPDILFAHAKDLDHDGEAGNLAAGTGVLDYDLYLSLVRQSGDLPLILHGLDEGQVVDSVAFVRSKL